MRFEWDENKRKTNFDVRGVDFARVVLVFDDPNHLDFPDNRRNYGEARRRAVGKVGDDTYVVIYTVRGDALRIITAWRLGRNAKRRYQTLYDRADPGDERPR